MKRMGRGYAWLDTGTHASLLEALRERAAKFCKNDYGKYLLSRAGEIR